MENDGFNEQSGDTDESLNASDDDDMALHNSNMLANDQTNDEVSDGNEETSENMYGDNDERSHKSVPISMKSAQFMLPGLEALHVPIM